MKSRAETRKTSKTGLIDPEIRDVLAEEMLGVCISALRQYGVGGRRLAALCNRSIARPARISTASKLIKDADQLANLTSAWMGTPEYVDEVGRPKVLPIKGPAPSFSSLVKKFFGGRRLDEIIELGIKTQVLERLGDDKVAQFGGCVLFTGNPSLMLVHAIQSMGGFLATTLVNATSNGSWNSRLPDRKASARIAASNVDKFVDVMRDSIINTIEMGNRWLMAHEEKGKRSRGGDAVKVGIHAYVFHERAAPPAPNR